MKTTLRKLREVPIKGRRVLVRVDFNVPLVERLGELVVANDARVRGALPTIQYVTQQGAKCILASHLGRPKSAGDKKFSLQPVGEKLSEILGKEVYLSDDCVGDGPKGLLSQLKLGEVLLLENLRFHREEEQNSAEFGYKLLDLCDVFVSDAFGTLHRAHASTYQAPRLATEKAIGLLVEKELEFLGPLRNHPRRPFCLIMGGAKVSDKIGVIEAFLDKADVIMIGGAMAYAFLKAQGKEIGKSYCNETEVTVAERLLRAISARNLRVLLPLDHVVTSDLNDTSHVEVTDEIPIDKMAVDIGPKTLRQFGEQFSGMETIFWNGPMGIFEKPEFAKGSFELARMIAASKARKLAGGGDVAAAIAQSGEESRFDFISTGGGATLEYLEGKELPGLKAIEISSRNG